MDYKETTVREGAEKEDLKHLGICSQGVMHCGGIGIWPDGEALTYLNVLDHPQSERTG